MTSLGERLSLDVSPVNNSNFDPNMSFVIILLLPFGLYMSLLTKDYIPRNKSTLGNTARDFLLLSNTKHINRVFLQYVH